MPHSKSAQLNFRVSEPEAARFEALRSFLGASKTDAFLWLLDLVRYLSDDQLRALIEAGRADGVYPGRLLADLVSEALERRKVVRRGAKGMSAEEVRRVLESLDLSFLK